MADKACVEVRLLALLDSFPECLLLGRYRDMPEEPGRAPLKSERTEMKPNITGTFDKAKG